MNQTVDEFRENVRLLGVYTLEKWTELRRNVTGTQLMFWKQMKVFDPSHKAAREEGDEYYLEVLNRIGQRLGYTNEQKATVASNFGVYLKSDFNRMLDNAAAIWGYWSAKITVWPLLVQVVLNLLIAPIGNSHLERSFRLVKVGSLASERQSGSAETKSVVNLAHVNGGLNLADIGPPVANETVINPY